MKASAARARNAVTIALGLVAGFAVTRPVSLAAIDMLPALTVISPVQNSDVTGTVGMYTVADSAGMVSLQFRLNGQNFGSTITSGSCRANWDTTQVNDGLHTIQAVGQDQYGNTVMSQPVTVRVNNTYTPPPSPSPVPTPAPAPAPTPGPTPAPSGSPNISYPVVNSTVSPTFLLEVHFPAGVSSVQVHMKTPGGVVAHAWNYAVSQSATRLERMVSMTAPVNGQYDLVATANGKVSGGVRVNVTGGSTNPAPSPTPTPNPTPAPTPSPSPFPTPTPTPGWPPVTPRTPPAPTPAPTPVPAPSPTPVPAPTPVPTPEPGLTPTPTPAPIFGESARTRKTTPTTTTPTLSDWLRRGSSNTPSPTGCTTPDPFKKVGGVGICVKGEWLALWLPKAAKK